MNDEQAKNEAGEEATDLDQGDYERMNSDEKTELDDGWDAAERERLAELRGESGDGGEAAGDPDADQDQPPDGEPPSSSGDQTSGGDASAAGEESPGTEPSKTGSEPSESTEARKGGTPEEDPAKVLRDQKTENGRLKAELERERRERDKAVQEAFLKGQEHSAQARDPEGEQPTGDGGGGDLDALGLPPELRQEIEEAQKAGDLGGDLAVALAKHVSTQLRQSETSVTERLEREQAEALYSQIDAQLPSVDWRGLVAMTREDGMPDENGRLFANEDFDRFVQEQHTSRQVWEMLNSTDPKTVVDLVNSYQAASSGGADKSPVPPEGASGSQTAGKADTDERTELRKQASKGVNTNTSDSKAPGQPDGDEFNVGWDGAAREVAAERKRDADYVI